MGELVTLNIPDLGGTQQVDVIEVLVKVGDIITKDDSLITVEGDKASMEVPATHAGEVQEVLIQLGDKVSEGDAILTVLVKAAADSEDQQVYVAPEEVQNDSHRMHDILVPDLGGSSDVDVIEVMVKPGDSIEKEQALLTLEGDKASMEVPATVAGHVEAVVIAVGNKVSAGDLICRVHIDTSLPEDSIAAMTAPQPLVEQETIAASDPEVTMVPVIDTPAEDQTHVIFASPGVRRLARELAVDIQRVTATGDKGRITKDDLNNFVKQQMQSGGSAGLGFSLPAVPQIDFSRFGEVELQPLSKIQKLSGSALHRNWVGIPHVTQFDQADVTEMEAFRQSQKTKAQAAGVKLTPIVFVLKAVVAALKAFPRFNASLDASGEQLIVKHYYHIGVAVDTPQGLVVPVIRDVDQKGLYELARELGDCSVKARDGALTMADMQGGCFTLSSLGGIGGTAFTPIINAPEVAIIGLSRSQIAPVWDASAETWQQRLQLPLSLSYDHRVIDGAQAARFIVCVAKHLADIRTLLL